MDGLNSVGIRSPVWQTNKIKQSIDRAPPLPGYQGDPSVFIGLSDAPIFRCSGERAFSSFLSFSHLRPFPFLYFFGDPSACLPYHAAKPSIYARICLSNYISASICLTISRLSALPACQSDPRLPWQRQIPGWHRLCPPHPARQNTTGQSYYLRSSINFETDSVPLLRAWLSAP